jgi:hypothetical protein
MFEDLLCSLSKSFGIHGVDAARLHGRTCVRTDVPIYPRGNFITDATVRPSHGQPSGHRPTVRPSSIVRVTTLVAMNCSFSRDISSFSLLLQYFVICSKDWAPLGAEATSGKGAEMKYGSPWQCK